MPYSLYVIELSREALGESRFATRNPEPREDKPCVYVGQTGLSPEERFAQHKYGLRLRPMLVANHGPCETRAEAEAAEAALAERLRRRLGLGPRLAGAVVSDEHGP